MANNLQGREVPTKVARPGNASMLLASEDREKRREVTILRDHTYKQRVARYHNDRMADKNLAHQGTWS